MKKIVLTITLLALSVAAWGQVTVDFRRDSLMLNLPYQNLLNVLASQVPGFYISPVDNSEGDMSSGMFLRGMNVIPKSKAQANQSVNAPLIVVDGVIFNGNINDLNTADVAKVEIVRDAAAVYGARAAGGAIVITTRKGVAGRPRVRFHAGADVSDWSRMPEGVNEDWVGYISRNGVGQQYDLSVSGGTERLSYYVSGNYTRRQGILFGDDYQKLGGFAKVEYRPLDWIAIGAQGRYTDGRRWGQTPRLQNAFWMKEPSYRYSQVPGYESWHNYKPDGSTVNPLVGSGAGQSYLYTSRFALSNNYGAEAYAKVDFPFAEGLSYRISYGVQDNWRRENSSDDPRLWVNTDSPSQMDNPSIYSGLCLVGESKDEYHDTRLINSLQYKRSFGKHSISLGAGYDLEKFWGDGFTDQTSTSSHNYSEYILQESYMKRLSGIAQYDYAGKVDVAFSASRDEFSSDDVKTCNCYYNAAIGWNVLADRLRVSASYGWCADTVFLFSGSTLPLPSQRILAGIDFNAFKGRVKGNATVYRYYTDFNLPATVFGGAATGPECAVSNTGAELSLRTVNLDGDGRRSFRWESTLLFAFNKNRVEKLYGAEEMTDIANALAYGYDSYYARSTGRAITAIYTIAPGSEPQFVGDSEPLFVLNLGNAVSFRNASLWFNLRWMPGGEERFLGYDTVNGEWTSRSFLKLSDLVLSYAVCKNISVYLSGTNLLTLSKWPALDPENGGTISASAASARFVSNPTFRTMRLGVRVTF